MHRYWDRRLFILLCLGFSSGLPLTLIGGTLDAWFTQAGRTYVEIGLLTLVGLPYTLKFLWAPLLDKFGDNRLGLRRNWMMITQLGLVCLLFAMSFGNPSLDPLYLAVLAVCIAIFSATQDIAIDAYRAEILQPEERGLGVAVFVAAYRVAMIVASGVALILADQIGWVTVYRFMAALMFVGVITTSLISEPPHPVHHKEDVLKLTVDACKNLLERKGIFLVIGLVVFYKFGDAFIAKMTTPFLLRELGFTLTEIGTVNKIGGVIATVVGLFVGGIIMTRLTLFRALLLFGFAQAISNLMYLWLAYMGHDLHAMIATLMIENFCGGMGTSAFLALLMSLCDNRFTAFHFALFSALSALPREILGPVSGYTVEHLGWISYFTITFIASFPGLIILWFLRKEITQHRPHEEPTEVH